MVHIRPLIVDDLLDVTETCVRAKAYWGYDADFINLCIPGLQLTGDDLVSSNVVGAFEGAELIGVAQLIDRDTTALLDKLFVEPDHIGSGIGRQLFRWSVQTADEWGAKKIVIESDPYAVPSYLAFGCTQIGEVRSELTGRPIPLMEYDLTDSELTADFGE